MAACSMVAVAVRPPALTLLRLGPRSTDAASRIHAYRRAAYDRDGVVLVKGVLTGRKLRLAQPIVGPSLVGPFQVGRKFGRLYSVGPRGPVKVVTVGHGQRQPNGSGRSEIVAAGSACERAEITNIVLLCINRDRRLGW